MRSRYKDKVNMCGGIDPYKLLEGADTTTSVDAFPKTTYEDIVNYLVLSTNFDPTTNESSQIHGVAQLLYKRMGTWAICHGIARKESVAAR